MPHPSSDPTTFQLPRWVYVAASVAILFHFGSVAARVLAAQSGPWPMGDQGVGRVPPPQFARVLANSLPGDYLKAVRLNRDYHFATNSPGLPAYTMRVRLKDKDGKETATVTIPDPNANFWVRHRQLILVNALADDMPRQTPQSEKLAPVGGTAEVWLVWMPEPNTTTKARLERKSVNDLPRGQMVFSPSPIELLFGKAYVRYLCRAHGAESAEVVRVFQAPIPPDVLFDTNIPSSNFDEREYNFGEELSK